MLHTVSNFPEQGPKFGLSLPLSSEHPSGLWFVEGFSFQSGESLALFLCANKDGPTCREKLATDDSALPLSLCGTKSPRKMIRKTKQ